jgi:putative ABC transport system substrate-binding protein
MLGSTMHPESKLGKRPSKPLSSMVDLRPIPPHHPGMDRRRFLLTSLASALATPLAAGAQQAGQVPRVGYISPGSSADSFRQRRFEAFRDGLRELGYIDGRNIVLEPRWAEGQYARYPILAADLVRLKAAAIVTVGGAATKAAKQVTGTIPIVMSVVIDPIGSGLVTSLARPGNNLTGTSVMANDLVAKQLELLKEVAPNASRMAVLWNPDNPSGAAAMGHVNAAARSLGVLLQLVEARNPQEIDRGFAAMTREHAGAVMVLPDAIYGNQIRQIVGLAAQRRLPAIYTLRENAEAGGLMVYGPNLSDLERRAATFVDKILKGAKPGDLPVEQPTKFELVFNLKTAKALGLTIPPSLLARADQIIE